MRRTALWALAALSFAACSQDSTAPAQEELLAFSAPEFGALLAMDGTVPGRGLPELNRLKRLPGDLALTAEQEAQISELLEAFQTANKADVEAHAALLEQIKAARDARDRAQVQALHAQAKAIRDRLAAAMEKLRSDIDAVLTQAQKDWLAGHRQQCGPNSGIQLTDAQKAQIKAIQDAFQAATAADRETVKKALADARAAHQAGASRDEVRAILDAAKPAMERLQAAGDKLRTDIEAVLTAEQLASGCYRRGR